MASSFFFGTTKLEITNFEFEFPCCPVFFTARSSSNLSQPLLKTK